MKRGGHKIKNIHSILTSASLAILAIAFAVVINLFTFNSDNTAMAISKQECENSGYDTTWEGTKCYQWVTDSSVNPGLACDSKTGHQTRGGVCKKRIEVQNKADMEANNEAASSSSGTTDGSADPDSGTDPDDTSSSSDEDSCEQGLHGFGWIVCPGQTIVSNLVNFLMTWIDGSMQYTVLANEDTTADTANSTSIKNIWQKFANIANIIFAIAFLVMIYSMATSTGLSNYHVKKILPKIIVMAVIVNISFYICAAALDISNIIGYNISEFIWSMSKSSGDGPIDTLVSGISDVIVFVAALFFGGSLIVALGIILLAIGFRHVVLTILVIISPVALSLYMLPNTEKWAKKWTDTFISLLIVYPAFGAVWGASRLLSNTFTVLKGSSVIGSISYAIMPTICSIAPAIAIIPLFKMSSGLMGYVAGRAMGSGIAKSGRQSINKLARNNPATRSVTKGFSSSAAKFGAKHAQNENEGAIKHWAGRKALQISNLAGDHARTVDAELEALDNTALQNANARISGMTDSEVMDIATGKNKDVDAHMFRAAVQKVAPHMNTKETKSMMVRAADLSKELSDSGQKRASSSVLSTTADAVSSAKVYNGSSSDLNRFRSGEWNNNAEQEYNHSIVNSAANISAESLSKKSADQIDEMNNLVAAHGSTVQKSMYGSTASSIVDDEKANNKLSADQRTKITTASLFDTNKNRANQNNASQNNSGSGIILP